MTAISPLSVGGCGEPLRLGIFTILKKIKYYVELF
jgi:hypothetical protein